MATATIKEEYRKQYGKASFFGRVANIDETTWEVEFWLMEDGQKPPEKMMLPLAHLESCVEVGTGATLELARKNRVDYFELAKQQGWRG